LVRWPFGSAGPRAIVLCYHSISDQTPFASLTPKQFEQHLEWLASNTHVVPADEVLAHAQLADSRPAVALTFDDGYRDNHENALPLLLRYRFPATFFVTTGFIDQDPAVVNRFARLRKVDTAAVVPLSWDQLEEMHSLGFSVGSHTQTHPNLAALPPAKVAEELRRSKATLEDRLQAPISTFAYPFGKPGRHFTPQVKDLVSAAGYSLAVAISPRGVRPSDEAMALPRFFINRADWNVRSKVLGEQDAIGLLQDRTPLWLARLMSPEDFRH
jgi:peptidoglycan/xylan/chitin deacetylase (PgdA/CDA1 family)